MTAVERKTRYTLIGLAPNKTAKEVKDCIVNVMAPMASLVETQTHDNGKECSFHEAIAQALEASSYFTHPYHSWERGLNENTNGLIRQYASKGARFDEIKPADVISIMKKLNNRPRKCLDFKTPKSSIVWNQRNNCTSELNPRENPSG